jgi:diacylglycerol kinase
MLEPANYSPPSETVAGARPAHAERADPMGEASARDDSMREDRTRETAIVAFPPITPGRLRAFLLSFVHAYIGMIEVLATQRNMVVHCIIAVPTLLAAQLLGFEPIENVVVLLCVTLVLACEAVNTAIEHLGTHASPGYHPAIRRAKDASAAMVLFSAFGTAAVGVVLFTSKNRLHRLLTWNVEWRWGGTIDNVMIKIMFVGIVWLFVHAWIYRHWSMEKAEARAVARWQEGRR